MASDHGVVAEGVSTCEQLAQLQALECDQAQGYYFAKPLSPEHAESYITERFYPAKSA